MSKKQKQKNNTKKEQQFKYTSQGQKNQSKTVVPKTINPKQVISEQKKFNGKKIDQQKKLRVWRHLDPWIIGGVIFAFGVLFVLFTAWAYQFDVAGSRGVIDAAVSTLTNTDTHDGDELDVPISDGKVNALDGTRLTQQEIHHPYAVMFDNHSLARPQANLQNASVVYETLVEGSITRFMGIFDHGTQESIGPIRSARPYFTQWADAIDAAYAHAGGSPEALQKIRQYEIKDVIEGKFFWRDYAHESPHNLFTSSELLSRAVRDNKWVTPTTVSQWQFDDTPQKGTLADGGNINLHFSGNALGSLVRWEYVPNTKRYKRFQAGVAHEDAATGAQITAKTIIAQVIPPIVSIGDHGRLTLNILGTGTAHIIFEGKRIEGTWKKELVSDRTMFYDESGEEIVFPRGNIFVEVIPLDHEVTFE